MRTVHVSPIFEQQRINDAIGVDPQPSPSTEGEGTRTTTTVTAAAPLAGGAVVAALALIAGDAAMAGVAAGARAIVPGPAFVAWFAAAAVIASGSFFLVGIPQVALGRRHGDLHDLHDRRGRWAVRLLARNSALAFVVASIVAGPLAVGWFAGRNHDAHAQRHTALSALVFGAAWAAVYLGAVAALF